MSQAVAELQQDEIFKGEMVKQMRAIDSYGNYDTWSDARVLEPFVVTKAQRREMPVIGDPDEIVVARIKAFYNAIATLIERHSKLMAVPLINLSHEGFGRVLITVGKLVVFERTLRDVHRFGFETLEAMESEAAKHINAALAMIERFPDVAGL
ncbi:NifX-associated nitrogen fixation protein [Pseudomonas sp.]|uniref:NifX-associated nitrogen fixation protein n=1 Tax=Pseudomonas sp. TaxID=306 RepID=UPI0028ADB4E9|nr:NifX-associated nitrogen fixation protein [Pseudomonas sp.]